MLNAALAGLGEDIHRARVAELDGKRGVGRRLIIYLDGDEDPIGPHAGLLWRRYVRRSWT